MIGGSDKSTGKLGSCLTLENKFESKLSNLIGVSDTSSSKLGSCLTLENKMKEYLMGNAAIAMGALASGVNLAAGYPGTPSSEIIETISKYRKGNVHVEWSVNEKAALEVAVAASYSGARALVTMKQMGLNVASDALMSAAYIHTKGGLVIVSADDPGPISSQTEQDTRRFADFCRIPVFDPASVGEVYGMIQDAFELSERYETPVLFRPTTRICHAYSCMDIDEDFSPKSYEGFKKDTDRFVIFPRLSYVNHGKLEKRNALIAEEFSSSVYNTVTGKAAEKAVAASGVSYSYVRECLKQHPDVRVIRIGTSFPFPEDFMLAALKDVKELICFEELSPYIEEQIMKTAGRYGLKLKIHGKLDGTLPPNGENSVELVSETLGDFLGIKTESGCLDLSDAPGLPVRPPVLCAGCPHRASFYAVKQAMKGKKAVFCGDIGCYTLGNAMPLDMVDTCLCMGAGITMAQGFSHTGKDTVCFSFTGDSTFFASGMTGVINAVYNEADTVLCILDNSTTAMTGHQPHPGTGRNMMGSTVEKADIEGILRGMGIKDILTLDPFDLEKSVEGVREAAGKKGVRAIIFRAPCIALTKPEKRAQVDTKRCTGCKKCIREIGCPALSCIEVKPGESKGAGPETGSGIRVVIDENLCTGCGLCESICPFGAIGGKA